MSLYVCLTKVWEVMRAPFLEVLRSANQSRPDFGNFPCVGLRKNVNGSSASDEKPVKWLRFWVCVSQSRDRNNSTIDIHTSNFTCRSRYPQKGMGYRSLGRAGCVTFESLWLHLERKVQTV